MAPRRYQHTMPLQQHQEQNSSQQSSQHHTTTTAVPKLYLRHHNKQQRPMSSSSRYHHHNSQSGHQQQSQSGGQQQQSQSQQNSSSSSSQNNPIQTFIHTIARLPPEEWRAKTIALDELITAISTAVKASAVATPPSSPPTTSAAGADNDGDNISIVSYNSHASAGSVSSCLSRDSSLNSYRSGRSGATSQSHSSFRRRKNGGGGGSHRSRGDPLAALNSCRPPRRGGEGGASPRDEQTHPPPPPPPPLPSYLHPNVLRHLVIPFRSLLTDLRTLVVKSACHNLFLLAELTRDKCRSLIKDLLPDVLNLHAQTVKVMHGYASASLLGIIKCCRFKSGLGILMRELRVSKSKDVRMVCVRYIRQIIDCWPLEYLQTQAESMGDAIAKALKDPSQQVRMEARNTFLRSFYQKYPQIWFKIVHTPTGVISRDARLKRTILLQSSAIGNTNEPDSNQPSEDLPTEDKKVDDKGLVPAKNANAHSAAGSMNPFSEYNSTPVTKNRQTRRQLLDDENYVVVATTPVNHEKQFDQAESELKHRAASSIQAAVRGVVTRQSLVAITNSPAASHPQKQRKQPPSHRFSTVAKMAERRKTLKGVVLPLPPTPGATLPHPDLPDTSPLSDGHTPTSVGSQTHRSSTPRRSYIPIRSEKRVTPRSGLDALPTRQQHHTPHRTNNTPATTPFFSPDTPTPGRAPPSTSAMSVTTPLLTTPLSSTSASAAALSRYRRRDSAILLQQRLAQSSSVRAGASSSPPSPLGAPTGIDEIGQTLLKEHKEHMNRLMAEMKSEMDVISQFEYNMIGRVNEEDVMEYFEKLFKFVDAKEEICESLKSVLERTARGEDSKD